ncbi:hypothetical protein SERLA73DRAFT_188666 [Serpula lacrymans var. lacrymans S7.3]|uniref:Uncharacterized protein n=2 Tax=Serpula lacrymans var. lacrymans TaxID=341189 RepID=F8QBX0_SERL3|nr:uncharacterized protein SERLADRAFT_479008 [Serpula lacrymans var. lacrymans S7.9]EGN94089.1 hypothetical protein SERLA73DRAFT_188666 [Serpula lacrymans var. lacrymans S7.3]EGO19502.1 hypothetical protein SERLADRAFT_479008 [Serpula lacrymans var. lacrymans S7.9]
MCRRSHIASAPGPDFPAATHHTSCLFPVEMGPSMGSSLEILEILVGAWAKRRGSPRRVSEEGGEALLRGERGMGCENEFGFGGEGRWGGRGTWGVPIKVEVLEESPSSLTRSYHVYIIRPSSDARIVSYRIVCIACMKARTYVI